MIDTGTYSVVDKIAAELAPDTVTVSWDGARLYATHCTRMQSRSLNLKHAPSPDGVFHDAPIDLAVSPDEAYVYITNLHSLAVLDIAANVVKSTSVGVLPRATRLSADGKWAYVLDFDQQTIWALDTADNSVVGTLDVGGHPEAMALGPVANSFMSQTIWMALSPVIPTAPLKPKAEGR